MVDGTVLEQYRVGGLEYRLEMQGELEIARYSPISPSAVNHTHRLVINIPLEGESDPLRAVRSIFDYLNENEIKAKSPRDYREFLKRLEQKSLFPNNEILGNLGIAIHHNNHQSLTSISADGTINQDYNRVLLYIQQMKNVDLWTRYSRLVNNDEPHYYVYEKHKDALNKFSLMERLFAFMRSEDLARSHFEKEREEREAKFYHLLLSNPNEILQNIHNALGSAEEEYTFNLDTARLLDAIQGHSDTLDSLGEPKSGVSKQGRKIIKDQIRHFEDILNDQELSMTSKKREIQELYDMAALILSKIEYNRGIVIDFQRQSPEEVQDFLERIVEDTETFPSEELRVRSELKKDVENGKHSVRSRIVYSNNLEDYQQMEEIGEGGDFKVYRAFYQGKLVTLKVPLEPNGKQFANQTEKLEHLLLLSHPNLVPILHVSEEGQFIVYEFIEGKSLHQIHLEAKKGSLDFNLEKILLLALDLSRGLEYIHSEGIIHRDVSPSNILIDTNDGRAKLTDYGLAEFESSVTLSKSLRSSFIMGTIPYTAPEIARGESTGTIRSDIFSFGSVLFESLTGQKLLPGVVPNFHLSHELAPSLRLAIQTMIDSDSSRRFENMKAVTKVLSKIRDEVIGNYLGKMIPVKVDSKESAAESEVVTVAGLEKDPPKTRREEAEQRMRERKPEFESG